MPTLAPPRLKPPRRSARPAQSTAVLLGLLALLTVIPGCSRSRLVIGLAPADDSFSPTTVRDDGRYFSDRVALINVSGRLVNGNTLGLLSSGENPVSDLAQQLDAAGQDDSIRAVILRINSPGGTVTASDIMYRELVRFREQTHKPVIALAMDVMASGGYYVACGADRIVAHPTSIVGSIGVIAQTFSVKPALANLGITTDAIVSGPNKDIGSPLGTLSPEQHEILQDLVNDFYHRFRAVVRTNRPSIPKDRFDELTDGRVLPGSRAVDAGLADRMGDLNDAFDLAKQAAGLDHADLVLYHRPLDPAGSAYARTDAPTPQASGEAAGGASGGTSGGASGGASIQTQVNLAQFNLGPAAAALGPDPGFYYLWQLGGR